MSVSRTANQTGNAVTKGSESGPGSTPAFSTSELKADEARLNTALSQVGLRDYKSLLRYLAEIGTALSEIGAARQRKTGDVSIKLRYISIGSGLITDGLAARVREISRSLPGTFFADAVAELCVWDKSASDAISSLFIEAPRTDTKTESFAQEIARTNLRGDEWT
jgi:hypothetical protein